MRLNYHSRSSLSNILYLNIILLHITLIYYLTPKSSISSNNQRKNHDHTTTTTTTTTTASPPVFISSSKQDQHAHDNIQLSEENKKLIIEKLKTNLLKALGLKEVPKKPLNKAYVPRDMLESYRQLRESVRDTIPNDRDFYGKIHVDELESDHEDFWSAVHNKFGSYDIEVDMFSRHNLPNRLAYQSDAKQVACLGPLGEPEDIRPEQEHLLLPHSSNKQFVSVLLKFNLTQEMYIDQLKVDDIKLAELHLSREKISDCENGHCSKKPVIISQSEEQNTTSNIKSESITDRTSFDNLSNNVNITSLRNRPRYQKVYILQVLGYDSHGDIMTKIHDSLRVNTYDTTKLKIDISKIIKDWLSNPEKNYGIVVRVTNDDKEFDRITMANSKNSSHRSNASHVIGKEIGEEIGRLDLSEHVRLKRDYLSKDQTDEVWIAKRPSLLIFSTQSEVAKSHVKREDTDSGNNMQADDPDAGVTTDYTSSSSAQPQTNDDNQNTSDSQTNKPSPRPSGRNRSNSGSRRDNRNSGNRSATSRSPSQTVSQGPSRSKLRGKPPRTEKCSKKTLSINFDEVGWSSWIIAPQAYYADYCVGDCSFPMSDHQNATNHAIIQSIYHVVGRPVPRSCCAPTKLGKMAILYQIDGGVQMREYEDMIVESCGCL